MPVLVILGIALVIFGAFLLIMFPHREGGEFHFSKASAKSPSAGVLLIILGVVVATVGYAVDPDKIDGNDEFAVSTTTQLATEISITSTTSTTQATPSTATSTSSPPSGCVIRVEHFGARIHEKPRHDAREVASVPAGPYRTADFTVSNWAGRDEGWFLITAANRQGWLVDNGIFITEKSSACP